MRPTAPPPPVTFSPRFWCLGLPLALLIAAGFWWGVYCLLF